MRIRIDLKIFVFFIIFYFTHQLRQYLIIMLFSMIHEFGHIVIALMMGIKLEKIEIIPFGVRAIFGQNFNENKIKEIIVALTGPITSFILAILSKNINLSFVSVPEVLYSNILIGIFNLIPIYPLDGGRIIKGILHIKMGKIKSEMYTEKISNITIILLTVICSIGIYYYKNIAIFIACIFLWWFTIQEKNDKTLAILHGK